jgi:putative PIN family toxin of toxin-antitoxin system
MLRVVVDTNVLVSSFLSETGPPAELFEHYAQGKFALMASQQIRNEYAEVLVRPGMLKVHGWEPDRILQAIDRLLRTAIEVSPSMRLPGVTADPKDDKFVECAIEGGADMIVSGDKHLLELGSYEGIQIVAPAVFVTYLEQESLEG